MLIALVAVRLPGHGATAAAAVALALVLSAAVLVRDRVNLRPLLAGVPVAVAVLAFCALPFLANGRVGELGASVARRPLVPPGAGRRAPGVGYLPARPRARLSDRAPRAGGGARGGHRSRCGAGIHRAVAGHADAAGPGRAGRLRRRSMAAPDAWRRTGGCPVPDLLVRRRRGHSRSRSWRCSSRASCSRSERSSGTGGSSRVTWPRFCSPPRAALPTSGRRRSPGPAAPWWWLGLLRVRAPDALRPAPPTRPCASPRPEPPGSRRWPGLCSPPGHRGSSTPGRGGTSPTMVPAATSSGSCLRSRRWGSGRAPTSE